MRGSLLQSFAEGGGVENIVAENQAHPVISDKFPANQQCIGNATGDRLLCIGDVQAVLAAISKQGLEGGGLLGGGR